MPQVIRDLAYFVFIFIKLIFIQKNCTGPFMSADSEGE